MMYWLKYNLNLWALLILVLSSGFTILEKRDEIFSEYEVKKFKFKGRNAIIVFPLESNEERLWIWRARFWGHEPQLDKALLDRGFHLVYVDVAGLFGNNEAVNIWNEFYDFVRDEYRLNEKAVLEGMSRGGLIVYNWASKNTAKVACIYADAPVCDIKSWPGGLYNGQGSSQDWEKCLRAYNLDMFTVMNYTDLPINNAAKIAEANIPVIHVCGDSDIVVPYEENTEILVKNFREAGGDIELILKQGVGHHPHSLKDPKPLVEFILNNMLIE